MNRRKLTKKERFQVYERCKGHCAYCGCDLEYKNMQADHVKPLHNGGIDELSNILPDVAAAIDIKLHLIWKSFGRCLPEYQRGWQGM